MREIENVKTEELAKERALPRSALSKLSLDVEIVDLSNSIDQATPELLRRSKRKEKGKRKKLNRQTTWCEFVFEVLYSVK